MNSRVLHNQVILITGAGKGIGKALVQQLLEQKASFPGLKLFLTSRTESDLRELKFLADQSGIECFFLACDLAKDPVAPLLDCIKKLGRIDVLLHSAGVGRFGEFLDLTQDDLQYVLKTNVEASFLLMQKTYAQMKNQSRSSSHSILRGQIQWITSVAAEKPFLQSSIYCMSKFAQHGLIEVMRQYGYLDKIRILEVKPGATETPMWGEVSPEMKLKMMEASSVAAPMIDAILLPESTTLEVLTLRPLAGDL